MPRKTEQAEEKPVPTTGAAWRREHLETEVVTLPHSGNRVRLRRPDLASLIERGAIPEELSGVVMRVIKSGGRFEIDSLDTIAGALKLASLICCAAFVEPRIVDDPKADDEIALDWVHPNDRQFVSDWAMGVGDKLKPFPAQPSGDVEAASGGDDVQPAAEPGGGNS